MGFLFPCGHDVGPVDASSEEHDQAQGDDSSDGEGQAREAFQEEAVAEKNEIEQLGRQGDLEQSSIRDEAQVAADQQHGCGGRDDEGEVHVYDIDHVGEQQGKGKEASGEQQVVHGVEFDAVHETGDDEHEKKDCQGERSPKGDLHGDRTGVQDFGHAHSDTAC